VSANPFKPDVSAEEMYALGARGELLEHARLAELERTPLPTIPAATIPSTGTWFATQNSSPATPARSADVAETSAPAQKLWNCALCFKQHDEIADPTLRCTTPGKEKRDIGQNDGSTFEQRRRRYNLEVQGVPPSVKLADAEGVETLKISELEFPDMPEAVLEGRLGDICRRHMIPHFPVAYAWPALVTVAGVMVPTVDPEATIDPTKIYAGGGITKTNLYTAAVGPVHSGKSQAIEYARGIMNLHDNYYSDVKAGSPEGLLKKLAKTIKASSLLMDIDEWKHYFEKASIDKSSFMTVLNSNFYKNEMHLVVAGGKEIDVKCSISWIGGIVLEEYGDVVGAAATGGFYDRMYQSICPSGHEHFYKPWEGQYENTKPVAVRIDASVWEVAHEWQRQNPELGRSLEVAIRIACICASFDGRKVLTGRDLEAGPTMATLQYQKWVRAMLQPNSGENPDAQCSNAILSWLQSHAGKGEWVTMTDLKRGLHYSRTRLGPKTFAASINALAGIITRAIEVREVKPASSAGRPKTVVRLVV
jgi:hypothetical protein